MIEIVPSDNDVLCGRGGATNNHPGNRNFRRLVADRQAVYLEAKKRDKADIARSIVRIVRESGGRFLKKVNESGDRWVDVGDKKATEKTSQALREGLEVRASLPAVSGSGVTSSGRSKRRNEGSDDSSDGESRDDASGSSSKRRRNGDVKPSPLPLVSAEGFAPTSSGGAALAAPVTSQGVDSKMASSIGNNDGGTSEALHFEAPPVSASDCSTVVEV